MITGQVVPKLGDFGLVRIRGGVGLGIRAAQWAYDGVFKDFEHVFVYVGDGQIVEAEPGGARMVPLSEYDGYDILWSTDKIELTDEQRQIIADTAKSYIGVPYSFLDYGAMALHRFHVPAPGLRQYIDSTDHMICSQLTDKCYLAANVHLFDDNRWPGYVAPSSFYLLLAGRN